MPFAKASVEVAFPLEYSELELKMDASFVSSEVVAFEVTSLAVLPLGVAFIPVGVQTFVA